MASIELTEGQRQVLDQAGGGPVEVMDPGTRRRYVLLAREQYERVRQLLEQAPGHKAAGPARGVPPGVLRAQRAFWRDLPELLKDKRNRGKWVAYHGDQRIGIARSEVELIRECVQRGLPDDEYDLDVIEPRARPPWEPEVIEPGGHEVDDVNLPCHPPGDAEKPA